MSPSHDCGGKATDRTCQRFSGAAIARPAPESIVSDVLSAGAARPRMSELPTIEQLESDYNVAVANGLIVKARRIARVIAARERAPTRTGGPTRGRVVDLFGQPFHVWPFGSGCGPLER